MITECVVVLGVYEDLETVIAWNLSLQHRLEFPMDYQLLLFVAVSVGSTDTYEGQTKRDPQPCAMAEDHDLNVLPNGPITWLEGPRIEEVLTEDRKPLCQRQRPVRNYD